MTQMKIIKFTQKEVMVLGPIAVAQRLKDSGAPIEFENLTDVENSNVKITNNREIFRRQTSDGGQEFAWNVIGEN